MEHQFNKSMTSVNIPVCQLVGKASKEVNETMILLQHTNGGLNIFLVQNTWKGPPGRTCCPGLPCYENKN